MVDTVNLLPPSYGPQSDPLLFGVARALELMFPPIDAERLGAQAPASTLDLNTSEDAEAA